MPLDCGWCSQQNHCEHYEILSARFFWEHRQREMSKTAHICAISALLATKYIPFLRKQQPFPNLAMLTFWQTGCKKKEPCKVDSLQGSQVECLSGFEPPTFGSGVQRSIQLSHRHKILKPKHIILSLINQVKTSRRVHVKVVGKKEQHTDYTDATD